MLKYYQFLKQYFLNERKNIALIFTFVMLSQLFSLAEPFFYSRILDSFLRDSHNLQRFPTAHVFFTLLTYTVLGWIGIAFLARVFKNFQQYYTTTVSDRIGINVFNQAYAHVIRLPMAFFSSQKTGEVFRKMTKARDDVTTLFQTFFDKIFQNVFSIAVVLVYVLVKQWRIGIVLIALVPVFIAVTSYFTRKIKKVQNEINQVNEKLFGTSFEALNHIEVVKSFASEEHEIEQVHSDNRVSHENLRRQTRSYRDLLFWQGTIINFARVVLLWYGAILAYRGVLSFADVILFNFYTFVIYNPLYDLGDVYTKYQQGINAVDRLRVLLEEPITIKSKPDAVRPERLQGKIEFKNVSFDYFAGDRQIIKDVSFVIEPGKKLSIVGLSGSGKSTIVKLLLRFYEPTSGQILIDGRDIRDYDLDALHRRVGLVLQDNVLFNTSLAENIRYGTFHASDDEVQKASGRAYLDQLVAKLASGLQTMVGERGLKISGGEKQRVAIARSIVKKPDILIFDEATSSLDSHSEEMIKQAINEVSQGVTTVTVAHRFATVVNSDEILLLENGKIVERGDHKQLVKQNGKYAELYRLQTQRQAEQFAV